LLDESWDYLLDRERTFLAQAGVVEAVRDPSLWPNFALKRARLRKTALRLKALVGELGPGHQLLPELELSAADGRLRGRADLVIRGGTSVIVDYKSGFATGPDTDAVRPSFERQLRLYEFMEHAMTGVWPERLLLFALAGPSFSFASAPDVSTALANRVLSMIDGYNQAAPREQPATVGPETCPTCPYAVDCLAFWTSYESTGTPDLIAVRGVASFVQRNEELVTFGIAGRGREDVIRAVKLADRPELWSLREGMEVALVSLGSDGDRSSYRVRPSTQIRLS
jgi:hypothetical protein